jgi:uncharacterized OB-fold protein
MKIKMCCSECGSKDVLVEAWASWDEVNQEWELSSTFNQAYCEDCDSETSINEIEIEDEAIV